MAVLPSGTHFFIDSRPLDELIKKVVAGHGLHLPDLMLIHERDDLRRFMRLLWLLPLGADCAEHRDFNALSAPVPDGLSKVDSGFSMHDLPTHLDSLDRQALEAFWDNSRCRAFLAEQRKKIHRVLNSDMISSMPEYPLLSLWFMPSDIREANEQFVQALREEGLL